MSTDTPDISSIAKGQPLSTGSAHGKHGRIDGLPDDLRELVDDLVTRHSSRTVAEVIRDAGHCLDIAPVTLQHYVDAYRRERIPPERCINPFLVERLTSRLRRNVNCLTAMSDLIALQQERIGIARMGELDGTLDPEVNKQIHLMTRMLKVYSDMSIKAGLMGLHVSQYAKECQLEEESMMIETSDIFFRILRGVGVNNPDELETWLDRAADSVNDDDEK